MNTLNQSRAPNLWDLILDLRWSWCNNNRNNVYDKCHVPESFQNHQLSPRATEKLSSMKPVRGANCFRAFGACMGTFSLGWERTTSGGQQSCFPGSAAISWGTRSEHRTLGPHPWLLHLEPCETAYTRVALLGARKRLALFPLGTPFLDPRRRLEDHWTLLDSRGPCFLSGKTVLIKPWRMSQYLSSTSLYQPFARSYHIPYLI